MNGTISDNLSFNRRFSVAPMLEWTDRHCRYLLRLISRHSLLYTEMVTTGALLHGDRARHLDFDSSESPVALQLGGSDPAELAACARMGEDWGYQEINLNCGCPSDRVQSGQFGACLMSSPERVAEGVAAMKAAVALPVTVKCRIGIDDCDPQPFLWRFVETVAAAGCTTFIVHARKAWLQGLSPRENRDIPPLDYPLVYRLKQEFPELEILINGGVDDLEAAEDCLYQKDWPHQVDGVMLGRAVYHNPYLLAEVDRRFFGDPRPIPSREEVVAAMVEYTARHLARGGRLNHVSRHLLGLYQGEYGGRRFRRHISEQAHRPGASAEVLREAASFTARAPDEDNAHRRTAHHESA